ncbi:MAG: hypothetical protein RMK20_10930, partial [Verrucomicrobiales bacterium]|nr:hypothetical protein [Verrucomicrobiales bacterium]
ELWEVKLAPPAAAPGAAAEPLFTAAHLRARYRLGDLLAGKIALEELALDSPTLNVIENADGSSNLDPILKSTAAPGPGAPAQPPSPAPTPALDLKRITITNATLRHVVTARDGSREVIEVKDFALALSDLKNGGVGRVAFSGTFNLEQRPADSSAPQQLRADFGGEFALGLTPELQPGQAQGGAAFVIQSALGRWAELGGLNVKLDCDVTPQEIRALRLAFSREAASLGEATAQGRFDIARLDGELALALRVVDRRVLNLFAAGMGFDFDLTELVSTNSVQIADGAKRLAVAGRLDALNARLTRDKATTPTLTVRGDYDLSYDRAASTALLKALSLSADQASRPLLRAQLTAPMTLALRETGAGAGDAALELALTDLDLAEWRAFAPEFDAAGRVNGRAKILARTAGQELHLTLDADARNLSARFGTQTLAHLDAKLSARGLLTAFNQLKLEAFQLDLAHQNRPALAASGTATAHLTNRAAEAQLTLRGSLPPLLALVPQPDLSVNAGDVSFEGNVSYSPQRQALAGRATLTGLDAAFGTASLRGWDAVLQLDVEQRGADIEFRKTAGDLRVGGQPAGAVDVSGRINPAASTGQLALRLAGVNERALRPFLESALGEKQLASLALHSSLNASLERTGNAAVQGELQITNLVVRDPKGAFPSEPLAARMQLDATAARGIAQIRQAQLALTPTARAKNELRLSGTVDFGGGATPAGAQTTAAATPATNAPLRLRGALKLNSDALDLTRFYDLFAGGPTATPPATRPATAPPPAPPREPEPMQLPFDGLDVEAAIARLWLRELDAQNVTLKVRLERSAVRIPTAAMTLNGAPVQASANADLSVPGYRYEASWDVQGLPVAPLADSFSPSYRGQAQGKLFTTAKIKGAGVTGRSLREHLNAEARLVFTNANIQLVGPKAKSILTPIALVLGAPELLNSPLDFMNATVRAGGGQIQIAEFLAHSPAFVAQSQGSIPIADVLSESPLNQEIEVSIARALATKLRFANVPTNVAYVKLPSFARLRGTLGSPDVKTDKAVILALTATSLGGVVGGTAGGILEGVGTLLGVRPAPTPGPAAPTAPAPTNAPSAATNLPPAATNPPAPPPNPVQDILNIFNRPRR